ncbi:MAG: DNA-directed RNA polymerase subunit alpha [bacterium]
MINLPQQPKIIKEEENKSVFEIEALYPGYGVTIGNSLRRVLLSSLSGAAVTQVKIKNAPHEFSTIPGVLEDVILIILNLKQLRFKLSGDEPQKAQLSVKGEKSVKAGDFKLPSQVELINKNYPIATLTDKTAGLEIEILIEKGTGYSSRDSRKKEKLEIGAIAVDAFFTPVKKVSYRIENMRVGERTDFDRLFLELETDGIISPKEAFSQASDILLNHFSLLSQTFKKEEKTAEPKVLKTKKKIKTKATSPKIKPKKKK